LFSCLSLCCAGSYVKKIHATELAFFTGDIDTAVSSITPLAQETAARDRLLFYMEAGIIYRAQGDLKTSSEILTRAAEMADEIKTSIMGSAAAFMLSDRESAFHGENFERALIRYYLAVNQVLAGELIEAKRTLRKLDADLKDMKYDDADYKQILIARYLDALISEEIGEYNDARVQYKNLENFGANADWLARERYALAARSGDSVDMAKYAAAKPPVMPLSTNENSKAKVGELVLLVETGKAAVKVSRGDLMNDQEFAIALRVAIDIAILSHGNGLSTAAVIAMLGGAENPVPKFAVRDNLDAPPLYLDGETVPATMVLTNFDTMAEKNFNDNYPAYVKKNVASIATKFVIAAVAADAVSRSIRKNNDNIVGMLGGLAVGVGAGGAVAATVKADLRSWHTLPAKFTALRIFLPEGKYQLALGKNTTDFVVYGNANSTITVTPGKKTFVALRTFKRGL